MLFFDKKQRICCLFASILKCCGKRGELRCGDVLQAPKPSSLCKRLLHLSSPLLLLFFINFPFISHGAICFLPDCNDKRFNFIPQEAGICLANGYISVADLECPAYSNIEYCSENSDYIKCNTHQWCLDNGYELTECTVPEYLDEQCPNGEFLYMYCTEDFARACQELSTDYVLSTDCPDGYGRDENDVCPYSDTYAKCCNLCEDFAYLAGEVGEGYHEGESCTACGGVLKYKRVINECEGYYPCSEGHKNGTRTCRHGEETWYAECCAYNCNLNNCPTGTECVYETCSDKYCAVGCLVGYEKFCTLPVTDCASLGYTEMECLGSKIKCPYDDTKYRCI